MNKNDIKMTLIQILSSFNDFFNYFHLMTLTTTKTFFKKLQPRIINCRPYKNFKNKKFKGCLLNELRK